VSCRRLRRQNSSIAVISSITPVQDELSQCVARIQELRAATCLFVLLLARLLASLNANLAANIAPRISPREVRLAARSGRERDADVRSTRKHDESLRGKFSRSPTQRRRPLSRLLHSLSQIIADQTPN